MFWFILASEQLHQPRTRPAFCWPLPYLPPLTPATASCSLPLVPAAIARGKEVAEDMGFSLEEIAHASDEELMAAAGRALGFQIHFDANQLRRAGVHVQDILEAGVKTRDEAAGFLKDKGFSQEDADALAPAVLAIRGWSKGGRAIHFNARQLRLAAVNVQGILEAGVETRDEAAGFLKDMGFSQEDADALATAVLAMRGWSKGGVNAGPRLFFFSFLFRLSASA